MLADVSEVHSLAQFEFVSVEGLWVRLYPMMLRGGIYSHHYMWHVVDDSRRGDCGYYLLNKVWRIQ